MAHRVYPVKRFLIAFIITSQLSGCGSIISRTVKGQGQGHQYYPGVQWLLKDSWWKYLVIIDLPLSMLADTLLLPIDMKHGPYE